MPLNNRQEYHRWKQFAQRSSKRIEHTMIYLQGEVQTKKLESNWPAVCDCWPREQTKGAAQASVVAHHSFAYISIGQRGVRRRASFNEGELTAPRILRGRSTPAAGRGEARIANNVDGQVAAPPLSSGTSLPCCRRGSGEARTSTLCSLCSQIHVFVSFYIFFCIIFTCVSKKAG